jgi:hypothetical protein
MDKVHIEQIANILKTYGAVPVVDAMLENMIKDSINYPEGAIIHQYIPIVRNASNELNDCRFGRFYSINKERTV